MVDVVERVLVLSYAVYSEDLVGFRLSKLNFLLVLEIELTFEVAFNEFNPTHLQRQVDPTFYFIFYTKLGRLEKLKTFIPRIYPVVYKPGCCGVLIHCQFYLLIFYTHTS